MYKQSPKAMLEMVHNINIKGHPGIIICITLEEHSTTSKEMELMLQCILG